MGTAPGPGTTLQTINFHNIGGSDLIITKSKPPIGTVLGATNPASELSEGLGIAPGNQSSAIVYFQLGQPVLNSDPVVHWGAWTLNTNDLTFGVHVLNFTGTLASRQVGPLLPNGKARFNYLGCFLDSTGVRPSLRPSDGWYVSLPIPPFSPPPCHHLPHLHCNECNGDSLVSDQTASTFRSQSSSAC